MDIKLKYAFNYLPDYARILLQVQPSVMLESMLMLFCYSVGPIVTPSIIIQLCLILSGLMLVNLVKYCAISKMYFLCFRPSAKYLIDTE